MASALLAGSADMERADSGSGGSDKAVQIPAAVANNNTNLIGTNPQGASPSSSSEAERQRHSWDHFLFVTNSNQAVEKLSQVFDQACSTNPCSRDDSMDDSDRPYFTQNNLLGMSQLCSAEATTAATATGLQHTAASWFAAATNGIKIHNFNEDDGIEQGANTVLERRLQRHDKRTVTSRMHEEIEVSPSHHIQVRLPPTNPVITSGAEHDLLFQQPQEQNAPTPVMAEVSSPAKTSPAASARATKDGHSVEVIGSAKFVIPVEMLEVKSDEAAELERSISELTMRSSYAASDGALQKIALPDLNVQIVDFEPLPFALFSLEVIPISQKALRFYLYKPPPKVTDIRVFIQSFLC